MKRLAAILVAVATITTVGAQQSSTPTARAPQVTFTKDVAPILQRNCQQCHRPGSIAPMSLLTYQDARPWARSIKQKVVAREMPPWHIDRTIGITKFKDDPSLSDAEVATISAWVDAGAPMGNPADMPEPRQFSDLDSWFIGKPDIVVTMDKPYILPKDGPDNIVDVLVDPGFTEDMYVMAIESKPADPKSFKVVHHFTTNLVEDPEEDPVGLFLNEYALGKNGDVFPPDSGRLIKAGTKINFNLHLNPRGEETAVSVKLGLKVYPKGTCAEVRRLHAAHGRCIGPRHPGRTALAPRRLLPIVEARAPGVVSAAHAQPRQGAVHRSDLPRPPRRTRLGPVLPASRRSPASATTSSAGTSPIRTRTTWRRCCRRARSSTSSRGTTTRLRTSGIRIRKTGSATASDRSTR